ncbi:phosphoesterase [Rhodococcus sp. MEB064]|nr:phosphoesterase [Rhodococcus sp. MEB064]
MTDTLHADMQKAVRLLADARSVTLLSHVQPDADTIGSALALAIALDRRGVTTQVSFGAPAQLPESMIGLPGLQFLTPPEQVRADADLVVTVDAGSRGRLGRLGVLLDGAVSLVIDHHRSNTFYGTHHVVDASAESTTAVVAALFDEWGVDIDAELAHCLFAGLVTDTGSFRWVRPGSHTLAERLLATGIDGAAISRRLLDTHPFAWLPMLGSVLGSARLIPSAADGLGLVCAIVRLDDSRGLRPEEIESVVDIVRTTAEAEVAAVFKQNAEGWAVSLRAKSEVDVSVVATALGGGGHRLSAGYTATGDIEDDIDALVAALG